MSATSSTATSTNSPAAAFVLLALWVAGFGGGAVFLAHTAITGEATSAVVEICDRGRQSYVCTGTWTDDGRRVTGVVEGGERGDVGETIDVRLRGDRAYSTSLRLPVILGGIALVVPALAGAGAIKNRLTT